MVSHKLVWVSHTDMGKKTAHIYRDEVNISPVTTVPISRKMHKNMFPAKVPQWSMIFPWAMVKMIPKIWNESEKLFKGPNNMTCYDMLFVCSLQSYVLNVTDLSWTVKQSGRGPLRFWVGELYCILETQRQVSCHKETGERQSVWSVQRRILWLKYF